MKALCPSGSHLTLRDHHGVQPQHIGSQSTQTPLTVLIAQGRPRGIKISFHLLSPTVSNPHSTALRETLPHNLAAASPCPVPRTRCQEVPAQALNTYTQRF